MSNLSDIKRRLITVKQTRQITGAMETVSVAKMRKATEVYEKSRAYHKLITDIMQCVSPNINPPPEKGKDALIVLSSERGLCGGFDNDIFAVAQRIIDDNTLIFPIGQTAVNYFRSYKNVDTRFADFSCNYSAVKSVADSLLKMYGSEIKTISVAYAEYGKQAARPTTLRILPPEVKASDSTKDKDIEFEPSPQQVLDALIPLYLSSTLYSAAVNNYAAEQNARHTAMSTATESADELIAKLSLEYNRARQSSVTGQIVEIVGATSALAQKGAGSEKRS